MKRLLSLFLLLLTATAGMAYTASVKFIKFDHNVLHNGVKGLRAHYKVNVIGLKGKDVTLNMYIESPKGTPVKDRNNSFCTTAGEVCSGLSSKAPYDNTVWNDFQIFIPNSEIHPLPGKRDYYVQAVLFSGTTALAYSDYSTFSMTGDSPANDSKSATVQFIRFDHNVLQNGVKGLLAHYKVNAIGYKGRDVTLNMYIESPKGTAVKDRNNSFCTTAGEVCSGLSSKATYDNTVWNDFQIFIPNSEIHPLPGKRDYYVQAVLFCGTTALARSDYSTFTMTGDSPVNNSNINRNSNGNAGNNNTVSRKYYMTEGRAYNGSYWVGEGNNALSLTLHVSPDKITVSGSKTPYINNQLYSYVRTEKNGDRVYCASRPAVFGANSKDWITISPDYKNVGWATYNNDGSWLLTQWWTSNKAEHDRTVAANRSKQHVINPTVNTEVVIPEQKDWRDGLRYPEYQNGGRGNSGGNSGGNRGSVKQQGVCSSCGGTGVNPQYYDEGRSHSSSRHEWVYYINQSGTKCPYCGRYTRHFHNRCSRCNAPTHY